MPKLPAKSRFQKLVEDISQLYLKARGTQVRFAWETGKRIVEEEQNGEMRQFFLLNQKGSAPSLFDWPACVELLPVKEARARKQLEARILKEGL